MNKICTSIEQSKKLIELGIDLNTADMYYMHYIDCPLEIDEETIESQSEAFIGFDSELYYGVDNGKIYHYIPAWSLSSLMNLLPSEFTEKGKYSETKYEIKIRKYLLTNDVDLYQIAYGNYKFYEDGSHSWKDMINTGEKEDLLDSAFQMICLLLENGKL